MMKNNTTCKNRIENRDGVRTPDCSCSVEVIRSVHDLDSLREDWNRLLWKSSTQTVELTHEWVSTYWKHFNDHSELFVLAARDDGELVGIAPLKITRTRRNGLKTRIIEFIAANESNYQDFIIDNGRPDVIRAMFDYLLGRCDRWDMVYLRHLPESSPTVVYLSSEPAASSFILRERARSRTIYLNVEGSWEEYENTISSKTRWKIRNYVKKLAGRGDVRSFHCVAESEFEDHMVKIFELHQKRWNHTETPSHFNDERCRRFYLETIPLLLPGRQIDIYAINAGESTVAMLYSFRHDENCLIQLAIFDTDYRKFSPSKILNHRFVEEAFRDGIKRLDFGDYYPYKETWGREYSYKLSLELYPRKSLRSRLIYHSIRSTEPVREGLKKIRPLRRLILRIRKERLQQS